MGELGLKLQLNPPGSSRPFSFTGSEDKAALGSCVRALEEERRKIDAFKRELPLCMQLISDAIEALREQQQTAASLLKLSCDYDRTPKAFEQFTPSKPPVSESGEGDCDKPSWMVEAQLWSQEPEPKHNTVNTVRPQPQRMFLNSKQGAGAFSPFVKTGRAGSDDRTTSRNDAELSISSETPSPSPSPPAVDTATSTGTNKLAMHEPAGNNNGTRKARRCWSPELHKRFIHALEQLGGSHAATPKQIREIMKVDGLTNDEVKSHLQKYRLHTRRPSVGSISHPGRQDQVVLLGGIWLPTEFATAAAVQQASLCKVSDLMITNLQQGGEKVGTSDKQHKDGCELETSKNEDKSSMMEDEEMDDGDGDGDVTETEDSKVEVTLVDERQQQQQGETMTD